MAKYITKDYYNYFSKYVPISTKCDIVDLWNAVADEFFPDNAELIIDLKLAKLTFDLYGEPMKFVRNREEVYREGFENYELLIKDALQKIRECRMLKKKKSKK